MTLQTCKPARTRGEGLFLGNKYKNVSFFGVILVIWFHSTSQFSHFIPLDVYRNVDCVNCLHRRETTAGPTVSVIDKGGNQSLTFDIARCEEGDMYLGAWLG